MRYRPENWIDAAPRKKKYKCLTAVFEMVDKNK